MFPPQSKRTISTNGKIAFEGTIAYAKNIDLSEDGFIKLAAPMCSIMNSVSLTDLNLPVDMFPWTEGNFKVLTAEDAFNFALSSFGSVTQEVSFSGANTIRVIQWVANNWFINQASAVYDYDGSSVSSNYTSRIANNLDFIELFVSRNTIVGRDADNVNKLLQYNTSFTASTTLTLPENFAITGAAFSNELMGVATKQRKNQGNAIFAVWDGSDTSANSFHPIDDPYILDIAAYKSSWVILTSGGQLLAFNGGGFDELGRLPMFDQQMRIKNFTTTTSLTFGKLINVDGDKIFVSCPSLPEASRSRKPYYPFTTGGAYCYDPRNGFYPCGAPSYSRYLSESISFTSNVGTAATSHSMETGDELWPAATSGGMTAGKTYYAIKVTDTTFKVATTYDNAIAGTSMDITDGSHSIFYVRRYDYGIEISRITDCGLVKMEKDLTGYSTSGVYPFFLGARVHPNNLSSARIITLNASVPVMHNRGYFTLGKFHTESLENNWNGVGVKHAKLKPQDKIIVKAKIKDTAPIIVGDLTLYDNTYSGESVTWDSTAKYFATMADLTGAEVGDEVHIYAGAGAGQSAHIREINGNATDGFEVVLDEALRGISGGSKSCVSIDAFKKIGTITAKDKGGVKKLTLPQKGPSYEIKVEMRGMPGLKISEVLPIRTTSRRAV